MAWVLVLVGVLTTVVAFLGLLVLALIRQVDDLDQRLSLVSMAIPGKVGRTGLRVGSPEPSFQGQTLGGGSFASSEWSDREHLVLFAHPGCPPCETLFPELVRELRAGAVPPTVVISEGLPEDHPDEWKEAVGESDLVVLLQRNSSISRRYETFVTPHLFVVDPEGRVTAQGIASTVEEAKAIIRKAHRRGTKRELVGERLQ
jgi:AhpC/TSA family